MIWGPSRAPSWMIVAAIALMTQTVHAAPLSGVYRSQLGKVKIKEKDGVVTGKLMSKGPCGFKKGTVVLDGTRLDDSVTGELFACGEGKGCGKKTSGLVMLLITRGGKAISGAAHFEGKCKTPLKGDAIAFRKGGKGGARGSKGEAATNSTQANDDDGGQTADKGKTTDKGKDKTADKGKGRTANAGNTKTADDGKSKGKAKGKGKKNAKRKRRLPRVQDEDRAALDGEVSPKARKKAEAKATEAQQLLQQGLAEEARALFEEAVEADKSYSQGYNGIGVTYYMRDRYDEAKDAYGLALEADPANPDVYYNLACIHALTNEKEQALGYLQIALLNGYVDLQTLTQDPDLKSLNGDERFEALKKGELQ